MRARAVVRPLAADGVPSPQGAPGGRDRRVRAPGPVGLLLRDPEHAGRAVCMAELNTESCAPAVQATCCEPSDKASCCNESHGNGCGCSAGAVRTTPDAVEEVRETV